MNSVIQNNQTKSNISKVEIAYPFRNSEVVQKYTTVKKRVIECRKEKENNQKKYHFQKEIGDKLFNECERYNKELDLLETSLMERQVSESERKTKEGQKEIDKLIKETAALRQKVIEKLKECRTANQNENKALNVIKTCDLKLERLEKCYRLLRKIKNQYTLCWPELKKFEKLEGFPYQFLKKYFDYRKTYLDNEEKLFRYYCFMTQMRKRGRSFSKEKINYLVEKPNVMCVMHHERNLKGEILKRRVQLVITV